MRRKRVFVVGATGTIGRATVAALVEAGHHVVCLVRSPAKFDPAVVVRYGDPTNADSITLDGLSADRFDAVVSCIASRTGAPREAWVVDYEANMALLAAAQAANIDQFVLLSAICVQKPRLAFQHAKLAFEAALIASGVRYSIVRPTAYFKSLSGQVERVRSGQPFLVFGNGELTACKPISDGDLARYLTECLDDESRWNCVLPIGGPGPAVTPAQQGEALFALLRRPPRFRHVPPRFLDGIVIALDTLGRVIPAVARKADLARIGRYYATESMLVLNPVTGSYDAGITPETGSETLFDYYAELIAGTAKAERGDHAVF